MSDTSLRKNERSVLGYLLQQYSEGQENGGILTLWLRFLWDSLDQPDASCKILFVQEGGVMRAPVHPKTR